MECLEPRGNARGALLELRWMLEGREPVDTSALEGARTFMRQLAGVVSAPEPVLQDIERWEAAIAAWGDALSAIELRIVDGRFVEPDTTKIDRRLLDELAPLAERLGAWVENACSGTAPGQGTRTAIRHHEP
jgi:hypothetical protein